MEGRTTGAQQIFISPHEVGGEGEKEEEKEKEGGRDRRKEGGNRKQGQDKAINS